MLEPSRSAFTSFASRSTARWREMVGHADEKRAAISPDDREPERNSRKISRRVGSESALKTASGEAIVSVDLISY